MLKSDNAIMAKVHSLYGSRLQDADYSELLQKRTINELAGYLKNETYYSETLSEVKEELVHREQLENLINRSTLDTYLRLMKYSYSDRFFLKMYITQNEIEQLLLALRLLNAGNMNSFIVSFPLYLSKHMSFDLFDVAKSKDFDDLLLAVKKSDYYQILGKYRPVSAEKHVDIPACETELLTYFYNETLSLIDKTFHGKTKENLKLLINYQIDLHNVSVIYRMKRFFKKSADEINERLVHIKTGISNQLYHEMLEAESYIAVGELFNRMRSARLFPIERDCPSERMFFRIQRVRKHYSQRIFRFSIEPMVVVFCYMTLRGIEANNIINIIEGIRYGLSPDEIRGMLVI